jgi:hypothetical protein
VLEIAYKTHSVVLFAIRKPIAFEAWCFTDLYQLESLPQSG